MHIGNESLKEKLLNTIGLYSAKLESLIKEGKRVDLIKMDMEHSSAALMFMGMTQILTMKWSLSGFSFSLVDEGIKLWKNFEKCLSVR